MNIGERVRVICIDLSKRGCEAWGRVRSLGIVFLVVGSFAIVLGGCAHPPANYDVQVISGPLVTKPVRDALQEQASLKNRHLVGVAVIPPEKDSPDSKIILIFEGQ